MNKRGMFLEVDLDYPEETHILHKDFPLAPERYNVTSNELSPINQFLYDKMKNGNQQSEYCEEKLIPTFHKRKRYILHIKCLLFYLSHGLVLEKVHRIVSFNQKPFLKDYILTLTRLRSIAAGKNLTFFVNVFKLLANSTYGKFAQNPNNFTFAKLCLCEKDLKKQLTVNDFYVHVLLTKM